MFTVTHILDSKSIIVSPNWTWEGVSGKTVVIRGIDYETVNINAEFAKLLVEQRLKNLLLNKQITLHMPAELTTTDFTNPNKTLICIVKLEDVNVLTYFPEFKVTKP